MTDLSNNPPVFASLSDVRVYARRALDVLHNADKDNRKGRMQLARALFGFHAVSIENGSLMPSLEALAKVPLSIVGTSETMRTVTDGFKSAVMDAMPERDKVNIPDRGQAMAMTDYDFNRRAINAAARLWVALLKLGVTFDDWHSKLNTFGIRASMLAPAGYSPLNVTPDTVLYPTSGNAFVAIANAPSKSDAAHKVVSVTLDHVIKQAEAIDAHEHDEAVRRGEIAPTETHAVGKGRKGKSATAKAAEATAKAKPAASVQREHAELPLDVLVKQLHAILSAGDNANTFPTDFTPETWGMLCEVASIVDLIDSNGDKPATTAEGKAA